jgi:choline dehydrogenase-like flavoprotein
VVSGVPIGTFCLVAGEVDRRLAGPSLECVDMDPAATEVLGDPALRALVDRLIPADDHPSGWQNGVGAFLAGVLDTDLRGRADVVRAGLAALDARARARGGGGFADLSAGAQDEVITDLLGGGTEAAVALGQLVRLTAQGYYGDPGNGGNPDRASWAMVGYRELPPGVRWPEPRAEPPPTVGWPAVRGHYDAIVVGAGAGGGVAACVLAEAGHRVLLVERGPWLSAADLRPDHLRNQRTVAGYSGEYDPPAGPPTAGNPRVFGGSRGEVVVWPTDFRWGNNAMTVGGGTRVFGAQAWRFCPEDFRMATEYGRPAGGSLADWPISYEDLAPFYDRAEWELGVSGDPAGNVHAGPRIRGYPMPPLPLNGTAEPLLRGARALGLSTSPVPMLINSVPYNGRGGCLNCGACVGFGCPGGFKNGTHNTVIPRAVATGRCDLLAGARVERVVTDGRGRVTGVALATLAGDIVRREVTAGRVFVAAGAIESARLLLNSASAREPGGLGNNADQVGRHLQAHVYAGALAVLDEPAQDCVGPGPCVSTNDFRHHNEGIVGGGMLANDFVMPPLLAWNVLAAQGVFPTWGLAGKEAMRTLYRRLVSIGGPIQEVPNPDARVTVDPGVRDQFGLPVARLSGRIHPEDRRTAAFLAARSVDWLNASGVRRVLPFVGVPEGPSAGQHQAGTCRMGTDPATSVTDPWGRVWGHDNLYVVDGSLHVTNGGVNPVLTILAMAYRIADAAGS